MREIVLDTETTGIDPLQGHRLVEIGCVELSNHIPTGKTYHTYLNPEREVPEDAFRIHNLSTEFLADKPLFAAVVDEFLAFIADSRLIIHNAAFDLKFLNYELEKINHKPLLNQRVTDTLALARKKHPGSPNSLDALCQRYGINNAHRIHHGALLDSEILAEVYLELIEARQTSFGLSLHNSEDEERRMRNKPVRPHPLPSRVTAEDEEAHASFIATLGQPTIWSKYQ